MKDKAQTRNKQLNTPILFMIFNRPEITQQVFREIKKAKPKQLFIAADGPKTNQPKEIKLCLETRKIKEEIDWSCEVKILFRDKNLGCKIAVSSAINWFFENVEQGIILEDDCLPSQSFFWFCEELLKKYKDNQKIMHIAGMTYVEKTNNTKNYSYHFARIGGIWGWATWRRAWKLYEPEMESFPQVKKERIFDDLFIGENKLKKIYLSWFNKAYKNTHTWDYQWTYTKIINNSINIMPAKNLVRNIGLGVTGATHTIEQSKRYSQMELNELKFPLIHPKFIVIDRKFNYANFKYTTKKTSRSVFIDYSKRITYYISPILPKWLRKILKNIKK